MAEVVDVEVILNDAVQDYGYDYGYDGGTGVDCECRDEWVDFDSAFDDDEHPGLEICLVEDSFLVGLLNEVVAAAVEGCASESPSFGSF